MTATRPSAFQENPRFRAGVQTSTGQTGRCRCTGRRRRGFTLIELMVVLGIIAVLISLALPTYIYVRRTASIARSKADISTIAQALDAYKHDFGDYPRFVDAQSDQDSITNSLQGNGTWLDYSTDRGARLLCFALVGPGPAGTGQYAKPGEDGYDGPGFRLRRIIAGGGTTGLISGRVWGPYIDSAKFKIETTTPSTTPFFDAKLLDHNGTAILYFPALPGPATISAPSGVYVKYLDPTTDSSTKSYYNSYDNSADTTQVNGVYPPLLDPSQMQYILGDLNNNGMIDTNETAATTLPYLLWTAGPDGQFGFGIDPSTANATHPSAYSISNVINLHLKTDDVTNFDLPGAVKK